MRRRAWCASLLVAGAVLLGPAAGPAPAVAGTQTNPSDHQHDATVHHPFDDVEHWHKVFDDPSRDAWQKPEVVVRELGLAPGMVVADIGAGTGYFEAWFSRAVGAGGKVYAVDIEPKLVAYLADRAVKEKTPNVAAVLAAPDDPRLPDASLDLIFICDTWHHIDDRLAYLRRLQRALKPGGVVAVLDWLKKPLPVGPPPEHKIAPEAVASEFAEAGWRPVRRSEALPYQYLLMFSPAPAAK